MARAEVVQLKCDRCKRVQLVPPEPKKEKPDFLATFGEKVLKYEDLCSACKSAIDGAWKLLEEWDRPINQPFGPVVHENKAPNLAPAPDFSPPKPHSGAAARK